MTQTSYSHSIATCSFHTHAGHHFDLGSPTYHSYHQLCYKSKINDQHAETANILFPNEHIVGPLGRGFDIVSQLFSDYH